MSEQDTRTLDPGQVSEEQEYDLTLRPTRFADFVGQGRIKDNLQVYVEAARRRRAPLDHVLLCGPPGLGKTTMAFILGQELGVDVHTSSGPAIEHKGQLSAMLTRLERGDVLFIDEIHRLSRAIEESLYTAVEDFRIDVVHGDGPYAASVQLALQPFTLVGATTRTALLTSPMLSRFGIVERLDYYPPDELAQIVERSAALLEIEIAPEAAIEIARRARGTPRITNRLLRRTRDFAEILGDGRITRELADKALARLGVDGVGLDDMDRRYLETLVGMYKGGPVGIDTLAAALSEPRDTLEEVYEPYLLQQGFVAKTARGRVANDKTYEHLGLSRPARKQESLF